MRQCNNHQKEAWSNDRICMNYMLLAFVNKHNTKVQATFDLCGFMVCIALVVFGVDVAAAWWMCKRDAAISP